MSHTRGTGGPSALGGTSAATPPGGVGPRIPLVDLGAQQREIAEEIAADFAEVIDASAFIGGERVRAFEHELAHFSGLRHCVGVGNGTDAVELALRGAGVGPGDEVVLAANTFIATAEAVVRAGARPVLVDCDPQFHLMDVAQAAARIGPQTRALIPTHLYGQLAAVEELATIAGRANLALIEDAAQSHGATRHGRPAGHLGLAACTSFYPSKNLGAYGDAGAVLTDSDTLASTVRALGNHGSTVRYHHPELGFNSRLDALQAVVLSAKLRRLDRWNVMRREAAARYEELLAGVPEVTLPLEMPGNRHVWHIYAVRVPRRDEVLRALEAAGIGAAVHYAVPIHLQGAFARLGHRRGDFPAAEAAADSLLSLPLFPHITAAQQERVVEAIAWALLRRSA